jgi:hypothetical protein
MIVTLVAVTPAAAGDYAHTIDITSMTFSWTVDGANLNVRISAKTDAWVGIGFNPTEAMKDANFILGHVKGAEVTVVDHAGTGKFQHMEDTTLGGAANVTNISGSESDGVTTIGFTIPLNSGDPRDPVIVPDAETRVLLAYATGRDSFGSKHKFRKALTVNLATGSYK